MKPDSKILNALTPMLDELDKLEKQAADLQIRKRDGAVVPFELEKIYFAIRKANESELISDNARVSEAQLVACTLAVVQEVLAQSDYRMLGIEEIQDIVENALIASGAAMLAKAYIRYRDARHILRASQAKEIDNEITSLVALQNQEAKDENSNKNPVINSTQRDYMAGAVSKDLARRILLPQAVVAAHEAGIIHFHDADYFAQREHNCDLINLEDMLQNGTVISETMIEKPHSFYTACNVTTQIVAQVASNQYGGQSFSLAHLSPFVEVSRQHYRKVVADEMKENGIDVTEEQVNKIAENRVLDEIRRGIQTIQYQLITLMTCNGQAPFVTVYLNIFEVPEGPEREDLILCIEEVLRQRIQGVKNEKGVWITPAFPKLIYALDEDNRPVEGSKYFELTKLAATCTAKRMVPDYISLPVMRELKGGDTYVCMGCRSFLTPDRFTDAGIGNIERRKNYHQGEHRYYGRFNQGVVTLNLVDVALSSQGEEEDFWSILDERLELCHKALRCRHERLLGTPSDVAPILWQHGALARLDKGEVIDQLLYNGYSTISLGYAGLYETTKYMTGKSHTEPEIGQPFAMKVMQALNDACKKWKAEENIDYSVYGTPLESTTYKFAKALQNRWGIVEGVTDHDYITNSYHVCVREEISAYDKLSFEAPFQALSPGGAISYVEVPDMQGNIPAVLNVMDWIYQNIMYAELNTKSDYCEECGYDGEIKIVKDEKTQRLVWECPNCGNRDQNKMSVARRTCGYIGTQFWNQGRTEEIQDRVLHI